MSTSRGQDDVYNSAPVVLEEPQRGELVPVGAYGGLQPSSGTAWPVSHARPELLSAAPDPMGLLRAYQRRWLLATGIGSLLAIVVMAAAWFVIPQTGEVVQYLHVSRNPSSVINQNVQLGKDDFEVFKATTMQQIKSKMSLTGALRDPAIAQLSIVQQHKEDPVAWLESKLSLDCPGNAEILQIKMRGSEGQEIEDLVLVVGAVAQAYFDEIAARELKDRDIRLLKLEKQFTETNDKLIRETKEIENLARQLGTHDPHQAQVNTALLQTELNQANGNLIHALQLRDAASTEIEKATLEKTMAGDRQSLRLKIQEKIHNDHKVRKLEEDLADYDAGLAKYQKMIKPGAPGKVNHTLESLKKEKAALEEKLAERIAELEEKYIEPERIQRTMEAEHKISVSTSTIARLDKAIEEYKATAKEISAKLHDVGGNTAEMINKQKLAENLRGLVNELDMAVRKARIEKESPQRVTKYGDAMPPQSVGISRKLGLVGLSGMASFGLVGLAIAFLEFQSRRITSSSDLRNGLGIRVVGSLPSLSRPGRKALAAVNGDLNSLLVESIDTVRTNLLHSAASEPMRVVMITSALDREGKTTVASQLAASLARGGRRTLLIDGDLRRPSAHRLFELPLEPGLCEVLRTEAELDDVIRPTRIAGLWMIAAGQYDLESIQALSKEGARDFFDMLRSRFDFIIVDAAPVLSIADSSMLGQLVDAAVLCVMRDVSQAAKVYEASEQLHSVGVEVLGAVINGEKATAGYRSTSARK